MSNHSTRWGLRVALAGLLTLPLVIGGLDLRDARAGAPPASWRYKDRVHKFSLKMIRDYTQIPLKVGSESTVVCKFGDPKNKGANRGTFNPEVEVHRMTPHKGPVTTGGGSLEGLPPELAERLAELQKDRNDTFGATIGQLRLDPDGKKFIEKVREKFKTIKTRDNPKIEGKLWQFSVPVMSWSGQMRPMHATIAEFKKEDITYVLYMNCGGALEKHYKSRFKQIAKSFLWFDKSAKDVEELDVLEGVNITARKRKDIEKGMVKGWAVIVSPKKNYIVIYNTKNGKNHFLAKVIAKRIEMIREQIYEVQFPPAKPIKDVCIVRVCKDAQEYHNYGGPGGSAGYWSPGDEELVFYDASASKKPDDDTLAVLYHEAFHQYIHYSVGRVAPHSWFNEGHGDYYAGAKLKGRKFVIKPFQWRVGTIRNAIVQGERPYEEVIDEETGQVKSRNFEPRGYTPLEFLVRFSQREYYSYPGVSYAQGWSLIYFLREIVPKNKKYNEKWGHILDTYFNTLKAEVNKDKSEDVPDEPRRRPEADEDDPDPADGDTPTPPAPDTPTPDTPTPDTPTPDTPTPDAPTPEDPDDAGDGDGDDGDGEGDGEGGGGGNFTPAQVFFRGRGGPEALKKAVDAAFKDIDWKEFTEAWLEGTKRGR